MKIPNGEVDMMSNDPSDDGSDVEPNIISKEEWEAQQEEMRKRFAANLGGSVKSVDRGSSTSEGKLSDQESVNKQKDHTSQDKIPDKTKAKFADDLDIFA
jgi:hypothetical protein